MREIVLAGLLAVTTFGDAAAQDMPRYDAEKYCRAVADTSGGSSVIFNSCLDMEQEAYDKRKAIWLQIPARTRSYCEEVAQAIGGSYTILDSCIDMEIEAAGSTPKFKY